MDKNLEADYDKIDAMLERIAEKQREAARLRRQLRVSIVIKRIWPQAFDDGSIKFQRVTNGAACLIDANGKRYELTKEEEARIVRAQEAVL